ncbi:amino acid adenylation domain-containing protein [Streptomyces sp. NPDC088925]|uniref:amino acid adenylation domain-containing protein n=1 Tax=Streptomyces sp. NPDC088925 TaxID=3365914 RepID=UPI003814D2D1
MNDPATSGRVPGHLLIPSLFRARAARTPDAPAVIGARGEVLSYAELAARADRFAAGLRRAGVREGDHVGVCLRRGPDLLAAFLGVWLAGGTYVPIDPHHPAARIAAVLADTGQPPVVTEAGTATSLPGGVRPLFTDTFAEPPADAGHPADAASRGAEGAVEFHADAERPAYVLHTSGSTGRPKGVLVPHGGIANRVRWLARRLRPGDRMLLKTTVGFDAAGLELFAPLVAGATVVLAPEGAERDPAALLRTVGEHRVTVLQGVPSVYRRLVEEPGWEHATALRLLFSAGEPLHAELCRALSERAPGAEIWNTYGPTEASVDITEHRWDPERDTGAVPIGRPIGNMRVVVLDRAGHPVPLGVPGELHAGGVGLALGYLGRPGQTAERFVPDPHRPGARLYRTGDRVRWRADGVLEYLGRLDQQVKVNGVRIEPGEVEAALAAHPWVRAAVVAATPDGSGGHRLVAWVQSRGEPLGARELRAFLRRSLPDPLVPGAFVPVTEFPLTPNGKIDRSALPDPADAAAEGPLVPVRTPAERAVAEEWARLTGTPADEIGATHNFFQLGGSSLMLNRLSAGLSQAAGRHIPATALLNATTVEEQAALLTGGAAGGEAADGAAPGAQGVVPVPRTPEGLPLSPGQRGLWLLDRLRPGSAEWNAPLFLTLPAVYEDAALTAALTALAERHEILRTRYALRGAEPVQLADLPAAWPLTSARAETAEELNALVEAEFARPFDLERGPVRRALAVRGRGVLTVVLSIHHIACDGWTSVVLERELRALAEAAHTGTEARLPELPVQYADHAVHQRARLTDERVRDELAHWTEVLAGCEPADLPADRARPAVRDGVGAAHVFTVPAELAERAAALGRACGATLQQTLLTAFATLVARLTGQWDVPVGVPVAGRDDPRTADVAGYFLNTLVLRCDARPEQSFRAAVQHVGERARTAFAHQALPFDRLVNALDDTRDPGRTPLYQVMFDVHEEGSTGTAVGDGDADAFRAAWRTARTDLTLMLQRRPDGSLIGLTEYATSLFDAATIERLTACWVRLLEAVTADPGVRLADADLLPPALRAELLAHSAGRPEPGTVSGPERTVEAAIRATARRAPGDTAVVSRGEHWSYERLAHRAASLAAHLRERGAREGGVVAVRLGRTPELIAAFLGTWRTGAAYVPLDPAAPDERSLHILQDAGARVLVTDREGAGRLAGRFAGEVLVLDGTAEEQPHPDTASFPHDDPALDDPARLAYLMYTSGSTGRPKGVAVQHGALLAMLRASQAHLDFGEGPDDAWLALAQVTFDISCTELFMPLLAGGRVVLADETEQRDPAAQLALIEQAEVSHLQVAPTHWQLLIDAGLGRRPLVGQTGGEPCPPALAHELSRRLRRFVNEYGLTETTIAATRWEAEERAAVVPVGRPYPHVRTLVLDAGLRPVPYGVTGELCVAGVGLALGYHGRAALTAAAFVPDPYGPPGARLFRTGDQARVRPDGTIEFAGRADGQVKIRGRRVETGEVQGVLAEHPAVAQVFVNAHGSGAGAVLVGYWTPAPGAAPVTDGELLDHCARRLPDYMLPALLVGLDALPLTAHNKVDTAALPVPDLSAALADEPWTAPTGPVEEALAEIWAEELYGDATKPVGARQSFFRIGGDSARAARVIARVQEEFDVLLPLSAVFERPTVRSLATAVEEAVCAEIATLTEAEQVLAQGEYQP